MTMPIPSPRELVVVAQSEARLRVTPEGLTSEKSAEQLQQLNSILAQHKATLEPLFGVSEYLLEDRMAENPELFSPPTLNLSLYYRGRAADNVLESLAEQLRTSELINSAYIKPGAQLASSAVDLSHRLDPGFAAMTCDFTSDQMYLAGNEFGINAPYAWGLKGGDGEGIGIIDVEGAWCLTHSDLKANLGTLVGGVMINDQAWRNHGTAVLGILGADVNGFGVTGICPAASTGAVSIFGFPDPGTAPTWGTGAAILLAADQLSAGDILVIELHFPGPPAFNPMQEFGHIPAEWWPDCLATINYATWRGIIVVAAAGNGSVSLDDPIYEINPPKGPFPADWRNPLGRNQIDTGSIFVGAGAPLRGIHYSNWGPGRSRLNFSNYGCMVDAQAWGREVTTCGFNDLQCANSEEFRYTTSFAGTSSATAIVAGAIGCLQGVRKASNKGPLTSRQVRQILRDTGSPQTDFPGSTPRPATERIGSLPNLKQMIKKLSEF
jgi:hypothetical protein